MTYVIGVDTGPMAGIVGLLVAAKRIERVEVVQCSDDVLMRVLRGLIGGSTAGLVIAVERFVVGPRAGRSGTPAAGRAAREQAALIRDWAQLYHATYTELPAGHVKPWATDVRLNAAGLLEATKGMRHARDAARHALFTAVRDCGLPDPLSKRGAS
jgi:hypothetical protein